jgi:hypothetical protein
MAQQGAQGLISFFLPVVTSSLSMSYGRGGGPRKGVCQALLDALHCYGLHEAAMPLHILA